MFVLSAVFTLVLLGVAGAGVAVAVCSPATAYAVTSSAPPPIGFWTDTSGAVWSPPGGFPGCAPGDSAADNNATPTTLIVNSSIPNPLSSLTIGCPGCTIDIQSGGSLSLAGNGSFSSSSTIIVEPGATLTVASGGALTFNSGTSLSVNGGFADIQSGGQLNIAGASTVTNNGTLNVAGGMAVNNLLTVQSTGHITFDGATVTGTNRINNLGSVTSTGNTTYGARLTGTPTVDVNGGTFTVSGQVESPVDVNAGTLSVTGSILANVNVKSGAALIGNGSISGTVNVTGGTVSPGASPGILHTGDLSLDSASTLGIELNGTTAGTQHDQIDVTGTVSLGDSTLNVTLGYTPAVGDSFTIVNNDSTDSVSDTFADLPEGATFCSGGAQFQIHYAAGTNNNDVVLTVVGAPNVATHFVVSSPANANAGSPFNFTVTALDACGNVATGYAGTVQFTSSDGQVVLPANSMLSSGTGTFPATLKTAGTQTITATDTVSSGVNGTSNDVDVAAGTATQFEVTAPSNASAGVPFNFTVTARDAFDNTVTDYAGTVHFTSSDSQAVLPLDSMLGGTLSATLKHAGTQTITATDTVSSGINGTSNDIDVAAGTATHFEVTAPSNASAGVAFNFTVTALDAFDNTVTGYTGTVHFTSSDSQALLPPNSMLSGTFSVTLKTAGMQTITATDTVSAGINGTSSNIDVAAGTATHFEVIAPSSASATVAFNFTVTARDAFDNAVTDYAGTVHFTSSDSAAVLPADSILSGTFSATLKTAGTQTITATDTVSNGINGTSNDIDVAAGTATHFEVTAPPNASAGVAFNFTVTALDAFNNTVTGYTGTVHFTSSDSQAVLPANSMLSGTFSATLKTAGTQTITATDTVSSGINGTSNDTVVAAGTATHFKVTAPSNASAGGTFNFTVTALDAFDNTATDYAGSVHFTSSDNQAELPADATLSGGTGTFSATLRTPGTQTITATDSVSSAITGSSNAITAAATAAAVPTLSQMMLALLGVMLAAGALSRLR